MSRTVVKMTKTSAAKPAVAKPTITKAMKKAVPEVKSIKSEAAPAKLVTMRNAPVPRVVAKDAPAEVKAPAPRLALVKEPAAKKESFEFKCGDFVVYPAHGVGRVEGIETHHIAGMDVTLYAIHFEKDRMILKVPVAKVKASGLRRLSSRDRLKESLETLQGRARIRRVMWSRRAQEYEAKINSGDPVAIAEVVRDLYRNDTQQEQSYSERQIYQAALERLAREVAAVEKIDEGKATAKLEGVLSKAA